jgi:hypothetical protein
MRQSFVCLLLALVVCSCSKDDKKDLPPAVVPDIIAGIAGDIYFDPIDVTTPDKGTFTVLMNNVSYLVTFNAVAQAESNATLSLSTDSILTGDSREIGNLGSNNVSYNPLKDNEIHINFTDPTKSISGLFDINTSLGGSFGSEVISQWRDVADPSKPNNKARADLMEFVRRYRDKDGSGPEGAPIYLAVTVKKQ